MHNNRNLEMTAEILRDYHRKALAFFRENLNPALAQYFNRTKGNSALLAIDPTTPTYIKNIQTILNLMLLADRAIAAYSSENDNVIEQLFTLSEYYSLVNETVLTLQHFDLKASPETQNLIALLRNHDRISFQSLTNTLPELAKLSTEITDTSASAIEKLGDVVSDVNAALNKSKESEPSNRQVIEGAFAVSAPTIGDKLEHKDSDERYVLNPKADGEVVTSIKRIANSLDYLNEALNFKLNAEKGQFFGGLVEGLIKYKEVIEAIYSLSPAILTTSEKMRKQIHEKAGKLIPVIREAIRSAVKMENESGLRPGYLLDQIIPFAKRYMEFADKIGMELTEDEKKLFISERQTLRKKASDDAALELQKTKQLKEKIDQVETLLNTSTPLSNFSHFELGTLVRALPLIQLPNDLKTQFKKEIDDAFKDKSVISSGIGIGWGYLINFAGHRISVQNQVWDHVRKQFSDVEAHENMLESYIDTVNFGRIQELLSNKTIDSLTLEEAEFLNAHYNPYADAFEINYDVANKTFNQIQNRIASLTKLPQLPLAKKTSAISNQELSTEELAAHSKNINSRNLKMAFVAKELRQFILGNIRAYFSDSVVENFELATQNGIYETFSDDPKHIQDMKNFLSALTVLERTFTAAESSYASGLMQASQLKDIAAQFHLNYQQQAELARVFFGNMRTEATAVGNDLLSDFKSGLNLQEHADPTKPNQEDGDKKSQGLIGSLDRVLSFSEWAYSYIDFKESEGSSTVDLKPYVDQMKYIKELTEQFIKDYFKEDFAKLFTPNAQGLYTLNDKDTAIVKDAKTLLNTLHHMATATNDVNNYLQNSYFDLPTAVSSISTFVTSLNELDLTSTHAQLCEQKSRLIDAATTYVNKEINPLLLKLMQQGDRYEQAIGLRQGVLTNHIQSAIDLYQAQHENLGVGILLEDDNAFLDARNEERNQFIAEASGQLEALKKTYIDLELQTSKQLPILSKWVNVLNGSNKSLTELQLLKSIHRNIGLLGDEKTIAEFAPFVDTLISNYSNLQAGHSREVKLFDMLSHQINIRYIYLQKKLGDAQKALDDFNATTGHRMAVIKDHQQTLIENRRKAEEAAIKSAEAREKAEEAQQAISKIKIENAKHHLRHTMELVENADKKSQEAHKFADEAQKLAAESHLGVAKRMSAEVKAEARETERALVRKVTPTAPPEVAERGFFAQIIISVLKFIADILDNIVVGVKALFTVPKLSPTKPHSAEEPQNNEKPLAENKQEDEEPTIIIFTGDELEDYQSSEELTDDSENQENKRPRSNDYSSYAAARMTGFHAQKGIPTADDLQKAKDQPKEPVLGSSLGNKPR